LGLIVDTNVFVSFERRGEPGSLAAWNPADDVFISAVTVSELLMGVWRADSEARRIRRSAFVEAIISSMPALSFDAAVARVHAEIGADLARRGQSIGAHDLMIAATARFYDFALLTDNVAEFSRVQGLRVVEFEA
jgi:tRNA(fMet)-specific endonuclease VapC